MTSNPERNVILFSERFLSMRAYLDEQCTTHKIDEKYKSRAVSLLPLAAKIGTDEYRCHYKHCKNCIQNKFGSRHRIDTRAIVDGLLYLVIVDSCGISCPLVVEQYHQHKRRHKLNLICEIRLVTGLKGRRYPELKRETIADLNLQPGEVEDIRAILHDPHFKNWHGISTRGIDPGGVVGAVIYLYFLQIRGLGETQRSKDAKTQTKIAISLGITEVCIRMRIKEILLEVPQFA